MSSKIKKCIDKLRGRGKMPEDLKGEGLSGEVLVPQVAMKSYESKGASTGEYDGLNESSLKREKGKRSGGTRRVRKPEQKIECQETYWGPTKQIGEAKLVTLLERTEKIDDDSVWKLVNRLNGSFNVAYILESDKGSKVCVRVPGCGFVGRWNERDAQLLRATALGMQYIESHSKLPIPHVLAYSDSLNNEINAPFIIMKFLDGQSVEFLWNDTSVERPVLEARRQKIMHSLANIMCTLSTTTFAQAGTLWFPDDDIHPVVGDSYRLDKDKIFAVKRDFLTFPSSASVADLLQAGREQRFMKDGFPGPHISIANTGVYVIWSLMIDAFQQSAALMAAGEPEFVLMQSDFNPQNILADESGNVTGIIDWDCLEAIPRQIGWGSLPHWLETDWYPDYQWPADIGIKNSPEPDQYDRYRQDYTEYLHEASGGKSDSKFTSRTHIYQALFDSMESFAIMECFVYNVLADILPRIARDLCCLVEEVGEGGFRPEELKWFKARLIRYFAPDAESGLRI